MVPTHIAAIMDGNGRWAETRRLPRTAGHKAGFDRFVQLVDNCESLGVRYLTVYALSTENLSRDRDEVSALFGLADAAIRIYTDKLKRRNIRLKVIGDISMAGSALADRVHESERVLSACTGMTLCVAFCYGGRNEILRAVNAAIASGEKSIGEKEFAKYLYTDGIPDPDLIIRTSGEQRISNFLLWQCAYSEYYFTDVLWPDFDRAELEKAVSAYQTRKRRYGK